MVLQTASYISLSFSTLTTLGLKAVKALVNHKQGDDVTSGYIQLNVERLRIPMQTITDFILKSAGIKQSADIVPIIQNKG